MKDAEAWVAEFAQLRELVANAKAQLARDPASRPEAEAFARTMIANCEHLRSLCSRVRDPVECDPVEYHELEAEYSDLIDEARELIVV